MKWRGRTWLQGSQIPRPGPVGQVDRWFETIVAFARLCVCGIETVIAFAGEKWAFLVHFLGAVVMAVSEFPCWGCAVVLLVSTSSCCRAFCAEFLGCFGVCCYKRRQLEVFFVWISAPLLQTSSIRGLFAENGGFWA